MQGTLQKLSKSFSIEICKFYSIQTGYKGEEVIKKQLLRSATSIGANIAESEYAASKADFVNKLKIALKECNETLYWLDLLSELGIDVKEYVITCQRLKRKLISSCNTANSNI